MPRRKRRPSRRRRPRRQVWSWLGLGALGLTATAFWLGRRPPSSMRSAQADPVDPPDPSPTGVPDDARTSWIPGPTGSVRVAERHPEGGRCLVFVHGLGGRLEHWTALVAGLGPGLRTVAFDLPGHGESDGGGEPSIATLAGAVGAVADGFALRRFVLVAHSLGALPAIAWAATHPERVDGLLLIDPSGDLTRDRETDRRSFLQAVRADPHGELRSWFEQLLTASRPGVDRLVLEALRSTPEEVLTALLEDAARISPLAALERYPGPVAVVRSDFGDHATSLVRLLPELTTAHVSLASHWLMMDRPHEVREILWDFLDAERPRVANAKRSAVVAPVEGSGL